MDLLQNNQIYQFFYNTDDAITTELNNYNERLAYRNPTDTSYLVDGYGFSGGRLIIKIRYKLLQNQDIQRTFTAIFASDRGFSIPIRTLTVVEKR